MSFVDSPARYFPVRPGAYRMSAGLFPMGTDFGNGERDQHYFQVDDRLERYRSARASASDSFQVLDDESLGDCHTTVLAWMRATVGGEHPKLLDAEITSYADLAHLVQEDFAVLHRREGERERAVAVCVSFPSSWRPERIVGADFRAIHGPVPDFAKRSDVVESMVAAMFERGPYVRFVWTITADDRLDHHPDRWPRSSWQGASDGWLRVERQVTVPFPGVSASLFLIRVYLYKFSELDLGQRAVLAEALAKMPSHIANYKGLDEGGRRIAGALLAAG